MGFFLQRFLFISKSNITRRFSRRCYSGHDPSSNQVLHGLNLSSIPCGCLTCNSLNFLQDTSKHQIRRSYFRGTNSREKLSLENDNTSFKINPLTSEFDNKPVESLNIDDILSRNKKWAQGIKDKDPLYFQKLSQIQKPKFLYFGCSDSRVPANDILGLRPGDVYVHRNVGNLVPGNDLNSLSVLEFAVEHLEVTDIIITGHYDCGAIKAATSPNDLGILENWLRLIRDVYRLHRDYLDSIEDDREFHRKLVELNVIEQCINVYKTGVVQRRRINSSKKGEEATPRIHGLVFDPSEGILRKLKVNFAARVGSLEHIYGLY